MSCVFGDPAWSEVLKDRLNKIKPGRADVQLALVVGLELRLQEVLVSVSGGCHYLPDKRYSQKKNSFCLKFTTPYCRLVLKNLELIALAERMVEP